MTARPALSRWEAAALGVALLAGWLLTWWVAVHTRPGQVVDSRVFSLVLDTLPGPVSALLAGLARGVLLVALGAAVVVLALAALVRHRPRPVLVAILTCAAVPLTYTVRTETGRPRLGVPGYTFNTFPSTHAAIGFALLFGALVLWPRTIDRRTGWTLVALAAVVALGNITMHDHRPADVLGSALLTAGLGLLAAAAAGHPIPLPPSTRGHDTQSPLTRARRVVTSRSRTRSRGLGDSSR